MIRLTKSTGFRGYTTRGNRNRAVAQLKRQGYNYFVFFKDVNAEFALNFGKADWVPAGRVYIDR